MCVCLHVHALSLFHTRACVCVHVRVCMCSVYVCEYTVYHILAHIVVAPTVGRQASGFPPQPTLHGMVAAGGPSGYFVF